MMDVLRIMGGIVLGLIAFAVIFVVLLVLVVKTMSRWE